jgi:hypothetical protein
MTTSDWTEEQARTARVAWCEYCTQQGISLEWAACCEEFVEMPDADLLGTAKALDFMVGARACFSRRDIDDYDAVQCVLEARGYDLRAILKGYRTLSQEEYEAELAELSRSGLIIAIPQKALRPMSEFFDLPAGDAPGSDPLETDDPGNAPRRHTDA